MMDATFTLGPHQEEWLSALESGKYKQGTEWLCRDDCYCCLGVAAMLTPGVAVADAEKTDWIGTKVFDGSVGAAPSSVMDWLALRCSEGTFNGNYVTGKNSLVELNDSGMPFAEIAALIRSRPQDFFTEPR